MNPLKVAYKAPKKKMNAKDINPVVEALSEHLLKKWRARDLKKYQQKLNNQKP